MKRKNIENLFVIFLTDGLDMDTRRTTKVSKMLKDAIDQKGISASFKVLGLCGRSVSKPIGNALARVQNIGNKFGTFDIISAPNAE